jgi:hypothetical protein
MPFGWVEMSESALQQLRRELEQKGQGVVDEMGVLTIHTGYADYFFPGTSVLQSRPRYLFLLVGIFFGWPDSAALSPQTFCEERTRLISGLPAN